MAEELADKKTEVTSQDMAEALHRAWCKYFGGPPERKSVLVLLSQWAFETAAGKSMHNFNVGNAKARPDGSYDFQYYACHERLPITRAKKYQSDSPTTAKITRDNGDGTAIIWFYPRHPVSCFRAFKTLDDGVFDHLMLLVRHDKFQQAWPAVAAGAPEEFCKLLRKAGYYTGDQAVYTAGVLRYFNQYNQSIKLPDPPTFTPEEQREIRNSITMNLQRMVDESLYAMRGHTDEDEKA